MPLWGGRLGRQANGLVWAPGGTDGWLGVGARRDRRLGVRDSLRNGTGGGGVGTGLHAGAGGGPSTAAQSCGGGSGGGGLL